MSLIGGLRSRLITQYKDFKAAISSCCDLQHQFRHAGSRNQGEAGAANSASPLSSIDPAKPWATADHTESTSSGTSGPEHHRILLGIVIDCTFSQTWVQQDRTTINADAASGSIVFIIEP